MKAFYLIIFLLFPTYLMSQHQNMILQSKFLQKPLEIDMYRLGEEANHMVFLTDGKKLLDHGALPILENLTEKGSIPPAYYVFVSTVHPETGEDHRNEYFFCNENYLYFFEEELIPKVEEKTSQSFSPNNRSLIGISFGGLSAAYFSAHSTAFKNYGLLSPITYPRKEVLQDITFSTQTDLRIYLSTGQN
ncbi:MAG: alpha/beta hydrolase-fold protein, partial [Bacteroidota bacterium]